MTREVIRLDEPEKEEEKPVEFTHVFDSDVGFVESLVSDMSKFDKVVYLGTCNVDGDMFAAYDKGSIVIYNGHLNSGKY